MSEQELPTTRDWAHFLDKRQRRQAEQKERNRERRDDGKERRRQRAEWEQMQCPVCHRTIASRFIKTIYDVPLVRPGEDTVCTCPEQPQPGQFSIKGMCWKMAVTIPGVQFPNGSIALSMRIPVNSEWGGEDRQLFRDLRELKRALAAQVLITEYVIEGQESKE